MIQAIGLTSSHRTELLTRTWRTGLRVGDSRKGHPPVLDDVSLEAHPGRVTALLGPPDQVRTALRLMLELEQGRGVTRFRGRPLHRIPHPSREVGVLLGDVPGHPGRTVRGHLRMLCAAVGLPVTRADRMLEETGLANLRGEPLGRLSRSLDRRLGMACALLADPYTLVLDAPAEGLAAREARWLHGLLRAHAAGGGTVLFTTADPKEAARTADRVVTLDGGRVAADQEAADFARTRLRPRVAVRSPHAARLGLLLSKEARAAHRAIEVVQEDGNRLSVYGSSCADVGEAAFRHGILVHQLADETGDMGPPVARPPDGALGTGRLPAPHGTASSGTVAGSPGKGPHSGPAEPAPPAPPARRTPPVVPAAHGTVPRAGADGGAVVRSGSGAVAGAAGRLPPPVTVRPARGPLRPLRYETYRATGVAAGYATVAAVLVTSAVLALFLARTGRTPQPYLLAGWPRQLPLPPAALGAGLLGAVAFGEEFRYPALAADRGTVPRRVGLLGAKLLVAAVTALVLSCATAGCNAALLYALHGPRLPPAPADWPAEAVGWLGLTVGCAWAGVLAAGVFRSTGAGLGAVLAVPLVVVPVARWLLAGPSVRLPDGVAVWLHGVAQVRGPYDTGRWMGAVVRIVAQPVGSALTMSLVTLLCAFVLMRFRSRLR